MNQPTMEEFKAEKKNKPIENPSAGLMKEDQELLLTILDSTKQGIAVFEPFYKGGKLVDFTYKLVNKTVRKIYGDADILGKKFTEVNPHEEAFGIFGNFKATMTTGKAKEFDVRFDRNESHTWYRITSKRRQGLLITTLENITARKEESQRLKESVRFKKHITGASPDIILILNLYDENIRYINRDLAPLPGMKKKDVLGKKLLEIVPFIHPSDREKAMDFHERVRNASDKNIIELEFRVRNAKGKYMWYNALGKVFMRNKKASVYEYMVLLRNIDEQIAIQKALITAEKLSIKGEVARTIAHELRNPLASIGMASDILKQKFGKQNSDSSNYFEIIKRSTRVLNKLVTELLNSSNYTPAVLEKKCLAEILESSLKMARDRIYLSGIQVEKEYTGPYYINADEEKLKIAILNILVNASEAMVPDEGLLLLAIKKAEENFILTVTDNGCGISQEQLGKLFDAFYTQKTNGIGVGLSSVKNILEEHDAKIEVDSEPDKGTSFHLSFHCYEIFERS